MTETIEVFWNARPYLARAGLYAALDQPDPRAERLFATVCAAVAEAFPDCVTLVRLITYPQIGDDLRVFRYAGTSAVTPTELDMLRRRIAAAERVMRSVRSSRQELLAQ